VFDIEVRKWLLKRYGRRVNPELLAELDHTIRRLQALTQRSASWPLPNGAGAPATRHRATTSIRFDAHVI
jgi:hypothetical protein